MKKVILNADSIRRSVSRISHEIVEKNKGAKNLYIIGIWTRGAPLADRIAEKISEIENTEIPCGILDTTFYRDDLMSRGLKQPGKSKLPESIDKKTVILVDDVLYTGRTVRAALDAIMDYGRPNTIQLAVLIDRGHRELPIRPDFIGKNVPTSEEETVKVKLKELDGVDEVFIEKE